MTLDQHTELAVIAANEKTKWAPPPTGAAPAGNEGGWGALDIAREGLHVIAEAHANNEPISARWAAEYPALCSFKSALSRKDGDSNAGCVQTGTNKQPDSPSEVNAAPSGGAGEPTGYEIRLAHYIAQTVSGKPLVGGTLVSVINAIRAHVARETATLEDEIRRVTKMWDEAESMHIHERDKKITELRARITGLETLVAKWRTALEFYQGAPWVSEVPSPRWLSVNLAKAANEALSLTEQGVRDRVAELEAKAYGLSCDSREHHAMCDRLWRVAVELGISQPSANPVDFEVVEKLKSQRDALRAEVESLRTANQPKEGGK